MLGTSEDRLSEIELYGLVAEEIENKEGWDISQFANKWDLIESVLTTDSDL